MQEWRKLSEPGRLGWKNWRRQKKHRYENVPLKSGKLKKKMNAERI